MASTLFQRSQNNIYNGRLPCDHFSFHIKYYYLTNKDSSTAGSTFQKGKVIDMSKGYTEIVYILDRSGSMSGLEADTIGGFNSMMDKQKKTGEKAVVSTVLFDDECEVIHDRVPIEKIEKMTDKQYYVRGCTALLDAVGGAIHHIGNVHKYAREEDRPEKTIFVITTDGMENASSRYSREKIEKMVKKQQKKYGWEFIFIGANIDAYAEAQKYGIRKDRTVNYVSDGIGTANVYGGVSKAVCSVMMAGSAMEVDECLTESGWSDAINDDYQRRGKKARR